MTKKVLFTILFGFCLSAVPVISCGGEGGDFIDNDNDGWAPAADCDDHNSKIHPLAEEIPYDGIDQDCSGKDLTDVDRDGYDHTDVPGGTDCDDLDWRIHPGATEIPYDGIDQNCDGLDHDGPIQGDHDGDRFVADSEPNGIDCDDDTSDDPAGCPTCTCNQAACNGCAKCIYPGAPERCNWLDDDCDGLTDEGLTDADGDGVPACLDCDDYDAGRYPGRDEIPYDGIDQDCDGADLTDVDNDNFPSNQVEFGTDCDDNDPNINPGVNPEPCNNVDDDCDGQTDEDSAGAVDADGDTWLDCTDCDDDPSDDPAACTTCTCDLVECHGCAKCINPGAVDFDANGIDDDCDGVTDEVDADGDGVYAAPADPQPDPADCCDLGTEESLGCDLAPPDSIYPGAVEIPYDGIDQDCDGTDLVDVDSDGSLGIPAGGDDCDDNNPRAYPGNQEDCMDPADNDCDGIINQDCGPSTDEEVKIAAGEFSMGRLAEESVLNPDQVPRRTVNLGTYYIDRYEVTVAQYRRCVTAGACTIQPLYNNNEEWLGSASDSNYWENQQRGLSPAINLTWAEAQVYCRFAGKDLPTEAQWEKAARGAGTDTRIYPWGDVEYQPGPEGADVRVPIPCDMANHKHMCTLEVCEGDTVSVNNYDDGQSPFGIYNLAGNVSEYTRDWYDATYYTTAPPNDPPGPATGTAKVVRGGGFDAIDYYLEVTTRASTAPNQRFNSIGWRCAR
jgi:formylglycine-generating enzyme required for sulfatase activity